jgi:hypothetical protein
MILGDGTEVQMGNTYGQGEVGDKRGSKEMDRCPLTLRTVRLPLQRGETDVEGITNDNLDSCDSVNSSRRNDSAKNSMFGK